MINKEQAEVTSRQKKELDSKHRELSQINTEAYKEKNVKKREIEVIKFGSGGGDIKEKTIEHITYKNGVIKSKIKKITKNGKIVQEYR